MDQELLSKKELLDLTGISYGQLYRWKRKNLIPDDWFIRKSTFTGQETFFPRERMLQRIEQIKNMKDDLSLDEMADVFSPNPSDISLSLDDVMERNIVTNVALDVYSGRNPGVNRLSFEQLVHLYVLDVALKTGEISVNEGPILLETLEEHYGAFEGRNCGLKFVRKLGTSLCVLYSIPGEVYFDSGTKTVFQVDLPQCIEELKVKLG
ncbi:YhbD family protein [Alicyclobacillus dauci]|uniref:YhbD family protein n=1 Tax=Alicyclobacillus dauci TaxID=1475485 RepID=A0ABY6Z3N1_9BACL|nr:YhbD family protein [Alicyclobacillus dauci]WAH37360.1 YhbD family protein [Alicyclobacillus dauci]